MFQLSDNFKQIFKIDTFCPYCGSIYKLDQFTRFCKPCHDLLISEFKTNLFNKSIGNHILHGASLINWVAGKSDLISQFILYLKGNKRKKQWDYLAYQTAQKLFVSIFTNITILNFRNQLGSVIVYPPSIQFPNHAYFYAKALSNILGVELLDVLVLTNPTHKQRKSKRSERYNIEFNLSEKFTNASITKKQVLFVDDVITSGATAYAAYKALNYPKEFKIITLANRMSSIA